MVITVMAAMDMVMDTATEVIMKKKRHHKTFLKNCFQNWISAGFLQGQKENNIILLFS